MLRREGIKYQQGQEIDTAYKVVIDTFLEYGVDFMLIGGVSAVFQGFDSVTKDVDLYIKNEKENNKKVVEALKSLNFDLTGIEEDILKGADFCQLDDPMPLDLLYAPDGFESYREAEKYKIVKDGIPCLSIEGIIKSKSSANRKKDRVTIPALKDFLEFSKRVENKELIKEIKKMYENREYYKEFDEYNYADLQTLYRWYKGMKENGFKNLLSGVRADFRLK